MEKYLYIVNPAAGKGSGKKSVPIISDYCIKNNVSHKIIITEGPQHATEIISKELNNFDTIVSSGGDGTLNEVINGFELGARQKLAVLPIGSGNDFIKNLGLNKNTLDNLSVIHNSNKNQTINVDVGVLKYLSGNEQNWETHKFINNLGVGFDAYVGYLNHQNKIFKGLVSYLYAVIKGLMNFNMISVVIKIDNLEIKGDRLMVSIGNGISSGGGFYLNPNASISDGELDVSVFDPVTRRRLLWALPMALVNKLEKVPEAKLYRTNNSIEIELRNPYYVHCDGEIITDKLKSADISIIKNAIKVIKNAE